MTAFRCATCPWATCAEIEAAARLPKWPRGRAWGGHSLADEFGELMRYGFFLARSFFSSRKACLANTPNIVTMLIVQPRQPSRRALLRINFLKKAGRVRLLGI